MVLFLLSALLLKGMDLLFSAAPLLCAGRTTTDFFKFFFESGDNTGLEVERDQVTRENDLAVFNSKNLKRLTRRGFSKYQ